MELSKQRPIALLEDHKKVINTFWSCFFPSLNHLAFDVKSWKAPLRIPPNIRPQRRPRTHCFVHSRWRRLAQTGLQYSVICFPPPPKVELSSFIQVEMWLSYKLSHTEVLISETNWCDWTSLVGSTQRFVVLYIWNAAAFLRTVGSVCVNDSNVYMNHYQGLYQDYLNMMPLKHVIAFIYTFFFYSLFLFDVV